MKAAARLSPVLEYSTKAMPIDTGIFNDLLAQINKLSPTEQLRATYGILADDPIERPPQPPFEMREPIE